jgi:hypothetical protein
MYSCPVFKYVKAEDFERPPKPGSSLGAMADDKESGTLGGYIRVSQNTAEPYGNTIKIERTYSLTNAHVVLGHDPKKFRQLWAKQCLHFTPDPTERLPA